MKLKYLIKMAIEFAHQHSEHFIIINHPSGEPRLMVSAKYKWRANQDDVVFVTI